MGENSFRIGTAIGYLFLDVYAACTMAQDRDEECIDKYPASTAISLYLPFEQRVIQALKSGSIAKKISPDSN